MLETLKSSFKEFGFFAGFVYLTDQVLSKVSPKLRLYYYDLMIQPILSDPLLPARFTKRLEFREIKQGNPDIDQMPIRAEIKQSRFRQGAICLGAYNQNELIGYIWFSFDTYREDEVRCTFVLHPKDQSVFDFDLYLFPKHRLGLGFASLWDGANDFLRSQGVHYSYSRLTRFNVASRRAHDRLGCKCLGHCLFLKILNVELMFSTILPFLYLSISPSNRVHLKMRPDALFGSGESL
jgi:hypothetical protein